MHPVKSVSCNSKVCSSHPRSVARADFAVRDDIERIPFRSWLIIVVQYPLLGVVKRTDLTRIFDWACSAAPARNKGICDDIGALWEGTHVPANP